MSTRRDCWNQIGVTGDRSCPELATHTHCRNCPTYAAAAATHLDRPIQEDAIDAATDYYAAPRALEDEAPASCFVFRLGAEWLALPTSMLDEVVPSKSTHALPHRRGALRLSLVSVRGDLVVHASLAGLLGIQDDVAANGAAPRNGGARTIVLAGERGRLATSVDEVLGVHRYHPGVLRPVPTTLERAMVSFTTAMIDVGDRVVGLLDGVRVVDSLAQALA
jgi:chemotaxis signal transduction protein